tara:strand:+ start:1423 stop:1599 length:177 start_codon:yes stop_codon:yes gene_type:complete
MSNNHQEKDLLKEYRSLIASQEKSARRAEIERLWFAEEATNKELLKAYKSLDVKKEDL